MAFEVSGKVNTVISFSTLTGVLLALWWAFGFAAQVDWNTESIKALHIKAINQEIRYYDAEIKKMRLYEEQNGESTLSRSIIEDFEKEIEKAENKKKCLRNGTPDKLCEED